VNNAMVNLFFKFLKFKPHIKRGLNGIKIFLIILGVNHFFLKFQMLHHWLASQEGFSIEW
jgi:hypothetical protein